MNDTTTVMFAKLKNFHVDIVRLQEHFINHVIKYDSVPYRDNQVDYVGWAVTSRDGSLKDGVRRIPTNGNDPLNKVRGTRYTELCSGYLKEVMDSLHHYGLKPYRTRIMRLENEGIEMPFHVDSKKETWRLHIPIFTNAHSLFEWKQQSGEIESVHLPADGSAWLVRVDIEHRAVNRGGRMQSRVHLLMGLNNNPINTMLDEPYIVVS